MAFRNINPNVLSPFVSRDKTWSGSPKKKQLVKASRVEPKHKEERGVDALPSFIGDIFEDVKNILEYLPDDKGWQGSPKRLAEALNNAENERIWASGTQAPRLTPSDPPAGIQGSNVPPEVAEVWNEPSSNTSKYESLMAGLEHQGLTSRFTSWTKVNLDGVPPVKIPSAKEWDEVLESKKDPLLLDDTACALAIPPALANAQRTNVLALAKAHNDSPHNYKGSLEQARPTLEGLEKLTTKLPVRVQGKTQSAPFQPQRGGLVERNMNYSTAARSGTFLSPGSEAPLPPAKKTFQPFSIYTDRQSQRQKNQKAKPASSAYSLDEYRRTLQDMSSSTKPGGAHRAEAILRDIIHKCEKGEHTVQPDGACYNSVIHAYAQVGLPDEAEAIMRLMFKDYHNGNELAEPNVRVFTNVLHAWRKSKDYSAPERCESILQEMQELSDSGTLKACQPDTFAVTVLLHCWTESDREDASRHAELIFRQMKNRYHQGIKAMRPDCIAYSIVLNTFAKESKHEEAEALLWEMTNDYLSGNASAKPRTRNFNTVMAMYATSATSKGFPSLDAPKRAEHVLKRLHELAQSRGFPQPDEYTYSLLLKSWCSVDIKQAVSCLAWMRELYKAGDNAACPDVIKYTTIISAYVQQGQAEMAESVLMDMIKDFELNGNRRANPGFRLFDSVIRAYTNDSRNADPALNANRAESLLRKMWALYKAGRITDSPRGSTYKGCIIAYQKSSNPNRAECLLREMDDHFKSRALRDGPTKSEFQCVINAWQVLGGYNAQNRATKLRVEMETRFGRGQVERVHGRGRNRPF